MGTIVFYTPCFLTGLWYDFQDDSRDGVCVSIWYNFCEKFGLDSLLNKGCKKRHILGGL